MVWEVTKKRSIEQARSDAAHALSPDGTFGAIAPEPSTLRPEPAACRMAAAHNHAHDPEEARSISRVQVSATITRDPFDQGPQRRRHTICNPITAGMQTWVDVANRERLLSREHQRHRFK